MGRGSGPVRRDDQDRRQRQARDVLQLGSQVVKEVRAAFLDHCVATFPRGATLKVLDRKGRRRILHDEADVTQVASRILYFTLSNERQREAWEGEPRELVRLIAASLYGEDRALHCADS